MNLLEHCIIPDWPAPARVKALQTTRQGGVSLAPYDSLNLGSHVGDNPLAVARNRMALNALLPSEPVWLEQVHGTQVADADHADCRVQADACIARQRGSVCAVMTADCLPVLLCDAQGTVVCAVHAGWKGLAAGVIEAAVRAMGVAPHSLMAWLGPAISQQAFEVGDEVRAAFIAAQPQAASAFTPSPLIPDSSSAIDAVQNQGVVGRVLTRPLRQAQDRHVGLKPDMRPNGLSGLMGEGEKWLADIYALARLRLDALGTTQIYGGGCCTYRERERFFSYRRDGATGRMGAFIWLT